MTPSGSFDRAASWSPSRSSSVSKTDGILAPRFARRRSRREPRHEADRRAHGEGRARAAEAHLAARERPEVELGRAGDLAGDRVDRVLEGQHDGLEDRLGAVTLERLGPELEVDRDLAAEVPGRALLLHDRGARRLRLGEEVEVGGARRDHVEDLLRDLFLVGPLLVVELVRARAERHVRLEVEEGVEGDAVDRPPDPGRLASEHLQVEPLPVDEQPELRDDAVRERDEVGLLLLRVDRLVAVRVGLPELAEPEEAREAEVEPDRDLPRTHVDPGLRADPGRDDSVSVRDARARGERRQRSEDESETSQGSHELTFVRRA